MATVQNRRYRWTNPEQWTKDAISSARSAIRACKSLGKKAPEGIVEMAGWVYEEQIVKVRARNAKELKQVLDLMKEHGIDLEQATELFDRMAGADL